MLVNRSLLKRLNKLKKKLPNQGDNMSIVIELRTEEDGGTQIWKIINGNKVPGSEADLRINKNQHVDFKVTLMDNPYEL
jgi:hypothetical protein